MLKFQIGRLTLKNFLLHWGVSLIVVILNMYFLKAIKEKEYITLIAMILFVIIFTKYYFKL